MSSLYAHIIDVPTGVRYFKADKYGLEELRKFLTDNNMIVPGTAFELMSNKSIQISTPVPNGTRIKLRANQHNYVALDENTITAIRHIFKDLFVVPLGNPIVSPEYEDNRTRELKEDIRRAERNCMEYPIGPAYSERTAKQLSNALEVCRQELKDYLASLS